MGKRVWQVRKLRRDRACRIPGRPHELGPHRYDFRRSMLRWPGRKRFRRHRALCARKLYDRMSKGRLMYSVGIGPPEEKSELCSLNRIRGGNEANEVD